MSFIRHKFVFAANVPYGLLRALQCMSLEMF